MTTTLRLPMLLLALLLAAFPAAAQQPGLSFVQVARTATLAADATCTGSETFIDGGSGLIFTRWHFRRQGTLLAQPASPQQSADVLWLEAAGGTHQGKTLRVSGAPGFTVGQRYILFLLDGGGRKLNPLAGGNQGIFRVTDGRIYDHAGRPVLGTQAGARTLKKGQTGERAVSLLDFYSMAASAAARADVAPVAAMQASRQGSWAEYSSVPGSKPVIQPLGSAASRSSRKAGRSRAAGLPMPPRSGAVSGLSAQATLVAGKTAETGLGACAWRELPMGLTNVDTDPWKTAAADGMWFWNQYADVFLEGTTPQNYGPGNDINELVGWMSEQSFAQVYDYTFGGTALAYCMWYMCDDTPCGEICETDIVLNDAWSWTNDQGLALDDPNYVLFQPVLMYQLAQCWGYQLGQKDDQGNMIWGFDEVKLYDVPTVMQDYFSDRVVEDGWGIHAPDAAVLRTAYRQFETMKAVNDVGIETWFANQGLNVSRTQLGDDAFGGVYYQGEELELQHLTLENTGTQTAYNVEVYLYLSPRFQTYNHQYDPSILRELASWRWDSLAAESTLDVTLRAALPEDLADGYWFVNLAIFNGPDWDQLPDNSFASTPYAIHMGDLPVGIAQTKAGQAGPSLLGWPVPATAGTQVQLQASGFAPGAEDATLTLTDLSGRTIRSLTPVAAAATLDTTGLSPGLYTAIWQQGSQRATTRVQVQP